MQVVKPQSSHHQSFDSQIFRHIIGTTHNWTAQKAEAMQGVNAHPMTGGRV